MNRRGTPLPPPATPTPHTRTRARHVPLSFVALCPSPREQHNNNTFHFPIFFLLPPKGQEGKGGKKVNGSECIINRFVS